MARGLLPLLVVAALLTSGCLAAPQKLFDWAPRESSVGVLEPTEWAPGNWWGYQATFKSGKYLRVALVVSEEASGHFLLGSNHSSGFFGLPFAGNVTREHKNPVIAGEEWPLFRFPLQVGKKWEYTMLGYPALADVVGDVALEVAGLPKHKGFIIEAYSYGHLFARYTYSPLTKWFTSLTLYEPTNGEVVVTVDLKEFGRHYDRDFFVQIPLQFYKIGYPSLEGDDTFRIAGKYKSITAFMTLRGEVGRFNAALIDPLGKTVLKAEVQGQGVIMDRKGVTVREGTWSLDHLGLGKGSLRLEIYGLATTRAGGAHKPAAAPPSGADDVDFIDFAALLAPAPASVLAPAVPPL